MVESLDGQSYLQDIGDGFIVCVKKGKTLTDEDIAGLREFRDFLRASPEEKRRYIEAAEERKRQDG